MTVLVNRGDRWEVVIELGTEMPTAAIEVGGHGLVAVDLRALLRDAC